MEKQDKLTNGLNNEKNKGNKIEEKIGDKENDNSKDIENDLNKDDFENVMKSSKIVDKNSNQIPYIKNWISPNQNIKCKLLYDGNRDRGQASIFHSFCNNKGQLLLLLKLVIKEELEGLL